MKGWLVTVALLAACGDPPPLTLKFRITEGDVQACTSSTGTKATSCSDVTMLCDAYVSIRIFAPSDPSAPFVSVCKPLATGATIRNVCSIAQVDLPAPAEPVKAQTLEVDMAVYPKHLLHAGSDGSLECPPEPAFGADNFPVESTEPCVDPDPASCPASPAIGGRAFYHPGDTETVVSLGCTNLEALEDPVCAGQSALAVNASVNDFDTAVSVSPPTADGLLVSVGEPTFSSVLAQYQLQSSQTHQLLRASQGPIPSWQGAFDLMLNNAVCLEVLEDGAQSTAALTCTNNIAANPLDLPGIRLSPVTLQQVLAALGTPFPDQGLVIGIALDYLGAPLSGVTIVPGSASAHVKYLSADRLSITTGTATTSSGIWVSQDAPFGTIFTPGGVSVVAQPGFGGLVHQKVDVVVIQFKPPGTGG